MDMHPPQGLRHFGGACWVQDKPVHLGLRTGKMPYFSVMEASETMAMGLLSSSLQAVSFVIPSHRAYNDCSYYCHHHCHHHLLCPYTVPDTVLGDECTFYLILAASSQGWGHQPILMKKMRLRETKYPKVTGG